MVWTLRKANNRPRGLSHIFQTHRNILNTNAFGVASNPLIFGNATFGARPAVISKAQRLEYDDVPERMVEVFAPAGSSRDLMRIVDR
jgi:hypothetical protein